MNIRVGFGYDVHKLVVDRDLWLGGIKIDYELGLLGHSDADVLIHAICDALLGAANMRDIGYHFPDTAAETLNVDSKILLRKTMELIATKGYTCLLYTSLSIIFATKNGVVLTLPPSTKEGELR